MRSFYDAQRPPGQHDVPGIRIKCAHVTRLGYALPREG